MHIKTKLGRSLLAITLIAPLALTGCGKSDPALDAISVKEQNWEKKAKGLEGDEKEIQSLIYKAWDLKDRDEVNNYVIENACPSSADRLRERLEDKRSEPNLPLNAYPAWRALSQAEVLIEPESVGDLLPLIVEASSQEEYDQKVDQVNQELSGTYQIRRVTFDSGEQGLGDRNKHFVFKKEDGDWKFCDLTDLGQAAASVPGVRLQGVNA